MNTTVLNRPTWLLAALSFWAILQVPRLIAIPLIQSVQAGKDHPMWLIPAAGDILIAVPALFIAYFVWRGRGLWVWVVALLWLALSIYDHTTTIITNLSVGDPHAFEQLFGKSFGGNGYLAPLSQGIVDAILFVLLLRKRARNYFIPELP